MIDKEAIFERQLIDTNCNDCAFMVRDKSALEAHKKSYEGTGLSDNLQFGECMLCHKRVTFSPNTIQVENTGCFQHRRS